MLSISGFMPALVLMVPREGAGAGAAFLLQVGAMVAIFYFVLIRPQQKEAKRHRETLAALKKGDEVVTGGGIIGTIVHAAEDRLTIKTGDNTRLVVQRARIAQRLNVEDAAGAGSKKD
jgi:preprotein translocase subunit YajC